MNESVPPDRPLSEAEERELGEFANEFRQARPALGDDALDRIAARVRREVQRGERMRRRFHYALAAAILLFAVGVVWLVDRSGEREQPRQVVFDTVTVPYLPPPVPAPAAGAILPLDDYRTLFTD
jgi:hypothetical protein